MTYSEAMTEAMTLLGRRPETQFVGQSVRYKGTRMFETLAGVPDEKKVELPVMEEAQMGFCIGLALQGKLPVAIYPRWNFLLLATNQLVNHLNALPVYSGGQYRPKVIIRVSVGSVQPLDPQLQHRGNFAHEFRTMCPNIEVREFFSAQQVLTGYAAALASDYSSINVEFGDFYLDR